MVRPAPNKKSTHRRTTAGSESSSGSSSTRFYSSNSLAQRGDTTRGQRSTPEVQRERPRESRSLESSPRAASESSFAASTPVLQRQSSSSISSVQSPSQLLLIPSPPGENASNRSRCLAPLAINQGDRSTSADDIMAKMEAFFERQKEFNDRLEQEAGSRKRAGKFKTATMQAAAKRVIGKSSSNLDEKSISLERNISDECICLKAVNVAFTSRENYICLPLPCRLNCRIPCHLFASHWIRIASIVFCFVLQRTPTNENNSGTEWQGIQQLLLNHFNDVVK